MCQLVCMTKSHWAFTLSPCAGEPVGLFSFSNFSLLEGPSLQIKQRTDGASVRGRGVAAGKSEDIKRTTWRSFTRATL